MARLDTLALTTPLTTEVFENRQVAGGFEFALPTPPLAPPPAPVVNPPVQPLVLAPLVKETASWLGYTPLPERVLPPAAERPPVDPPPFYGSIQAYKGGQDFGLNRTHIQDFNASVGYRTNGHCGRNVRRVAVVSNLSMDDRLPVDYSSSVFEEVLHSTYRPFLPQIGSIPGVAAR